MYLNDHFHQVFLGNNVFAVDDLLQNTGENGALVHVQIDTVKLAEPDEICADQDAQLAALQFAFFAVSRVPLVLEADPELVHFNEICEDK
jgi:hypothetical protein